MAFVREIRGKVYLITRLRGDGQDGQRSEPAERARARLGAELAAVLGEIDRCRAQPAATGSPAAGPPAPEAGTAARRQALEAEHSRLLRLLLAIDAAQRRVCVRDLLSEAEATLAARLGLYTLPPPTVDNAFDEALADEAVRTAQAVREAEARLPQAASAGPAEQAGTAEAPGGDRSAAAAQAVAGHPAKALRQRADDARQVWERHRREVSLQAMAQRVAEIEALFLSAVAELQALGRGPGQMPLSHVWRPSRGLQQLLHYRMVDAVPRSKSVGRALHDTADTSQAT